MMIEDVDADAESVARTIALRTLTARARTRHELEQSLHANNVPHAAIDAVLERLEEVGLVNDTSFAVDWVTSRQRRRRLSRRVLRRELQAKGVDSTEIDTALDHHYLEDDLKPARLLYERKLTAMSGLSRDVQYRRLAGMLSRRGFDASVICQVLDDLLSD